MAEEEADPGGLSDVSNSEAYRVLDELVDAFSLAPEAADAAKSRYSRLHAQVVAAMAHEKELLDEARRLKRKLDVSVPWGHAGVRMRAACKRALAWHASCNRAASQLACARSQCGCSGATRPCSAATRCRGKEEGLV